MCGKGKGLSVWDLWGWLAGQEGRTGEHWAGALLPWPVSAPRKSHGQRSLVDYSPWGHKELDMTEQLSAHTGHYPMPHTYSPGTVCLFLFFFLVCLRNLNFQIRDEPRPSQ